MFVRMLAFVSAVVLLASLSFAEGAKAPVQVSRTDYQTQIQDVSASTQAHVQALEAQVASAPPEQREALQRQIADTKRQGEISRLEILLNWAREKGDAARVTEIEQALNNWQNPPQPQQLPQIEKPASVPTENSATTPTTSK